jgi:glycosyltransferase involved in cell wall biosynthesis
MSNEIGLEAKQMKVLLLADIASEHTERWALGLARKGVRIGLFSFNKSHYAWYENVDNIELLFEPEKRVGGLSIFEKVNYFRYYFPLKRAIESFNPDILHAHYASSYGLLGALSGFKRLLISVWGSDVFEFPKQNSLYPKILRYALSKPKLICSTSFCMREEAMQYTEKPIEVVPFGIDLNQFQRLDSQLPFGNANHINIGCIKSIDEKYGTKILVKAFIQLIDRFPQKPLRLFLIGDGPQRLALEKMIEEMGLKDSVVFTGRIPHVEIPEWHKKLDVFVSLSTCRESFGVSLVEAMASRSCIIASDADGFREVLGEDGSCGSLVTGNSVEEAFEALSQVIENPSKALSQLSAARERVEQFYNWEKNLDQMVGIYNKIIES